MNHVNKMTLLPEDAIKSVSLSLETITIGQSNSDFFETLEDITFRLDDSEKLSDWGRDQSDYFKAFGNILISSGKSNEKNFVGLDADFNSLDQQSCSQLVKLLSLDRYKYLIVKINLPIKYEFSKWPIPKSVKALMFSVNDISFCDFRHLRDLELLSIYSTKPFDLSELNKLNMPEKITNIFKLSLMLDNGSIENLPKIFETVKRQDQLNVFLKYGISLKKSSNITDIVPFQELRDEFYGFKELSHASYL